MVIFPSFFHVCIYFEDNKANMDVIGAQPYDIISTLRLTPRLYTLRDYVA